MSKWIDIGDVNDFPVGARICVDADGQSVVVSHLAEGTAGAVQGGLCALVNMCPHAGLPFGDGELNGAVLTCPYHGYAFNVSTGRNIDYPDDTPAICLPIRVVEGKVEVNINPLEA